MAMIGRLFEKILEADARIRPEAGVTPLERSAALSRTSTSSGKTVRSLALSSYAAGAGALPLPAVLSAKPRFLGRSVVLIVSGGNVSPEFFR